MFGIGLTLGACGLTVAAVSWVHLHAGRPASASTAHTAVDQLASLLVVTGAVVAAVGALVAALGALTG